MDWFRSWHGAPTDNKWLVIAHRSHAEGVTPGMVSALAWALLDYASQNGDRGSVEGFDAETYAIFAGWSEDQIEAILEAMRGKGVITKENRLAAWEKRQPKKEDNSGPRVKAFRNRQKELQKSVTPSNADVTPSNAVSQKVTTDKRRIDESRKDSEHSSKHENKGEWENGGTYPPGFDEFERNFILNLINAVKERDPRQSMAGGFSLSDASKAVLLQVMTSGPVLSAAAIEWGLDQWEAAKPKENFRVQDKGCINWLLTTMANSYKPARRNGKPPTQEEPKVTHIIDPITGKVIPV